MAKAVFITKVNPTYDDLPEVRYHFPATYYNYAKKAEKDWIIYYEPRRTSGDLSSSGGRQSYFASAYVDRIEPDPQRDGYYYAYILTPTYQDFPKPVSYKEGNFYYESALRKVDGSTNKGAFGRSIRLIPDAEYELIVQAGIGSVVQDEKEVMERYIKKRPELLLVSDVQQEEFERPIVERLIKRPVREAAFSKLVKGIYQQTCAMTGLKIINGGGRSEVEAAHIRPVSENGPDSVRNGIALCGTVHWMFDRGLISISEDYSILKAKNKIPQSFERLLNSNGKLFLPEEIAFQPHQKFLEFHREKIFKG